LKKNKNLQVNQQIVQKLLKYHWVPKW